MVIEKETQVLVGAPSQPLCKELIDKLIANFRKVDTIEEAYQYVQSMNGEMSIVLGIKLSVKSENARIALCNAMNNSLDGEKLHMPLDVIVLDDRWLQTARGIEGSLFYQR